jgi:hypothetical protein
MKRGGVVRDERRCDGRTGIMPGDRDELGLVVRELGARANRTRRAVRQRLEVAFDAVMRERHRRRGEDERDHDEIRGDVQAPAAEPSRQPHCLDHTPDRGRTLPGAIMAR